MKTLLTTSISIIILLSASEFSGTAQKLIESRQTSYYTYIYKISEREARKLYGKNRWKPDTTLFHALIDSFPTDSQYIKKLPQGHYLKTYSEKNIQKLFITSVHDFQVYLFNNNTDLCIQVYDLDGNRVDNAIVSAGSKRLRFDRETKAYVDRKSNKRGILKVRYNGFSAYFNFSRQYNNSALKRGALKVIYGTPVKYVWLPVNYVVRLPVDGVKSVVMGWPQGTINRTKYFFQRISNSLFDPYYSNYKSRNNYKGYMVFNKPKYLQGDTVKFKTFIVNRKGNPVHKTLKVILNNHKKEIELTELQPYRNGGYSYAFFLHDSLQLDLDRDYQVHLTTNGRNQFMNGSFRYEDYELTRIKLNLTAEKEEHFRNNTIRLFAAGIDENGQKLQDARLEVLVTPQTVNKYFRHYSFIPDTLMYFEKRLNPESKTEIAIMDSIFPEANFSYIVRVRMLNSNNESVSESKDFTYYYKIKEFEAIPEKDSIRFEFLNNGESKSILASIYALDNFGNKIKIYEGTLPFKQKLNPYHSSYFFKSDSLEQTVSLSSKSPVLQCYSKRTSDSVHIFVDNPHRLSFMYNLYVKNKQELSGFGDSLNLRLKTNSRQNYIISLRYLWGGQVKEENYRIPVMDKKLNISVKQPHLVYPGQKTKIDIFVTDIKGKPVEGVDLTAFSITGSFNSAAPMVPYLGKERRNKRVINNFSFKDFVLNNQPGLNLDYDSWKIAAGLDSIEYYRFIYPGNSVYRFEYSTADSITQFAPFVIRNGRITPVHVVYADRKPLYFSWSTNIRPYSFPVDSGFHQIELRTTGRSFVLDSVYFKYGRKTILSIDYDSKGSKIRSNTADYRLSEYEKRILNNYILPYRYTFGERLAYIDDRGYCQILNPRPELNTGNFAGPVAGDLTFNLTDSFSLKFEHEPYFEYSFSPEKIKMRQIDSRWDNYPEFLYYNPGHSLRDSVFTKKTVQSLWQYYLDSVRTNKIRYSYPESTPGGAGRLELSVSNSKNEEIPLNILVFKNDQPDFLRVYPGSARFFHELYEGYYKLVLFYSGARYHVEDSIYVQPNGLTHYNFSSPSILSKDSFSISVSNIIEEALFKPGSQKGLNQIYKSYHQQFRYAGDGDFVEGYVSDDATGEALPGVNIFIEGTLYGTITDSIGYYSIKVPYGYNTLNFSYIGYLSEDRNINTDGILNVKMKADICALQEVVVVGYSTSKRSELTSSVVTISSMNIPGYFSDVTGATAGSLEGKVAGLSISGIQGSGVRLRGISTVSSDQPLLVIDGNIYNGDIAQLDSLNITNIEILKNEEATSIYGARAANGVIIIETGTGTFSATKTDGVDEQVDGGFSGSMASSSSIRKNFSDFAFWQPEITTDKEGKATFKVTFPDDVTNWKTYYLAMNDDKQSGQFEGSIKSYKSLMAQLAVPRFLVSNDTAFVIGKVLNYTADSINVEAAFEIDSITESKRNFMCGKSAIDTMQLYARKDSITVKYLIKTDAGYYDGEQRSIAVFPRGLEEVKGDFYVLDNDTSLNLNFNRDLGAVKVYARADALNVLEDEIEYLIKYKYSCNEQLASKLKALLAKKAIYSFSKENFKNDHEIEKLIRLLAKNQNDKGLWGWWGNSRESVWISLHVIESLIRSESQGYKTTLNRGQIIDFLIWELQNTREFTERVRILKILRKLDSGINYMPYIADLERTKKQSLNELLQLFELTEMCDISFNTDTLNYYQDTTMFGNIYFKDDKENFSLHSNTIQNTLLAYNVLKADSTTDREKLSKIRLFFLEERQGGRWRNTYESSRIIESILPDLMQDSTQIRDAVLKLTGSVNKTITDFPYEAIIPAGDSIQLSKSGDTPVYLTTYHEYWNDTPDIKKTDFEITTSFDKGSHTKTLPAGKETRLIVDVNVKKDADYVMINVPIPAGCSYSEKKNNLSNETHREYYKNETGIFCEHLPKGEYTFEINLISRFSGTYTLNPAKVELMYFPTFNANNEIKTVIIK